jgi:hypothetical protein
VLAVLCEEGAELVSADGLHARAAVHRCGAGAQPTSITDLELIVRSLGYALLAHGAEAWHREIQRELGVVKFERDG